jgi:hypothetical protein
MRDEFDNETKRTLAQRAGNRCSNPKCSRPTSGPRSGHDLSVNIGVAAHIHAASPGGPRYDELMRAEDRRDIRNGIWLCQLCAKLIDNDEHRFTSEVMYSWKTEAEMRAIDDLEHRVPETALPVIESQPVASACIPVIRIELNIDHSLRTPIAELKMLITRLAVRATEGNSLGVEVVHVGLDEYFTDAISDPVERATYRKMWVDLEAKVSGTMQLLFSRPVREAWFVWLCNSEDYLNVAEVLLKRCGAGSAVRGVKLDVWRTADPELSAPIYLSDEEVDAVLSKFAFKSMKHLAFGAGWRSADELPRDIVVRKVLPRILMEIESQKVDLANREYAVLGLASWHIGQG